MYWMLYRLVMRLSHRFDWHYAPKISFHSGDTQRWCTWCGFREVYRYNPDAKLIK